MFIKFPAATLADAQLPDFGQISIVAAAYVIGTILGGTYASARGAPFEQVQRSAVLGGLFGGWVGIAIFVSLLIEDLL